MAQHHDRNNRQGRRGSDARRPEVRIPWARVAALVIGIGCWVRAAFVAAAGENTYTGTPWGEIWSLVGLGLAFISFALFARWMMTTSWDRKVRDLDSLLQNITGIVLGLLVGGQNAGWMTEDARTARQTHKETRRERQRQAPRAPQPQARPVPPPPARIPAPAPQLDARTIKLAAASEFIDAVHTRAIELGTRAIPAPYLLNVTSLDGLMADLGRKSPIQQFRQTVNGIEIVGARCPNLIRAGRQAGRQALLDVTGGSGIYSPQNYQAIRTAWAQRVQELV